MKRNQKNWIMALLLIPTLAACGPSDDDPSGTETPAQGTETAEQPSEETAAPAVLNYHRDIAPIVSESCLSCHGQNSIAPIPLTNYEEVKAVGALMVDSVTDRRMPPWGIDGSGDCNEYSNGRWLTDAQIDLIGQWFDQGMPEGNISDAPEVVTLEAPELLWVSTTLDIGADYEVNGTFSDDYRCFVVDVDIPEDQFMTGFKVNPGNNKLVHHVIVYDVLDDAGVAIAEELDAADPGPGYTCFGSTLTPIATSLVGWAPGSPATQLPEGTGLPVSASRKLVIQVHYNTLVGEGTDRTTVDLQLQDRVDYPAIMSGILDYDLILPPNQENATTVYERTMADLGLPTDVAFYGVFPHMHNMGTTMRLDYLEDGKAHCQTDVPAWDFNWQQHSFYTRPVLYQPEDLLRLTCNYDTRLKDTITPWGDFTNDEMCLMGLYYVFGRPPGTIRPGEVSVGVDEPEDGVFSVGQNLDVTYATEFGGRTAADFFTDLVTAEDGSVYVGAVVDGSLLRINDETISLPGERDGLVAKYDDEGKLLWYKVIGGEGEDQVRAVTLGTNNSLWVIGSHTDDITIEGNLLPKKGSRDLFVLQIDADGTLLNQWSFGGSGNLRPRSARFAQNGQLYVAGYFSGSPQLGESKLESGGGSTGMVFSMSPSGDINVLNTCVSTTACRYRGLDTIDDLVIIGGYFSETTQVADLEMVSNGGDDGFIMALSQEDGSLEWHHHFGDAGIDRVEHVTVDNSEGIYMTGSFGGTLSLGELRATFTGSTDALVAKMDLSGTPQWLRTFGDVAGEYPYNITSTDNGVVLTGNHNMAMNTDLGRMTHTGSRDIFLTSYDSDGNMQWAQTIGNKANDRYPVVTWGNNSLHLGFSAYGLATYGDVTLGGSSDGQSVLVGFDTGN